MDKHVRNILELNKKFYIDKKFNLDTYLNELSLLMKSCILDYNMYLQIHSNNILYKYNNFDVNEIIKNKNDDNISNVNVDLEVDNENILYNYENINNHLGENVENVENVENIENIENVENDIENINDYSINMYYSATLDQCCARIGNEEFNLDDYEHEFIDQFPSGVYINKVGKIIGRPCLNNVTNFDENNNFMCNLHKDNYEDIRLKPY